MVRVTAGQVRVSLSSEKLLQLMASGAICVADLVALDGVSHMMVRQAALEVCARKLQGAAPSCDACQSQALCQQYQRDKEQSPIVTLSAQSLTVQ